METIQVRPARDRADFDVCVTLQRVVWGLADLEVTSALQLIATTHAGAILQLAETPAGQVVGFAYAFPALRGGVPHLHSDMLAVVPEHQKHGVGVRLKWAQREEALARGLTFITWTYDPMQAGNASLNLRRLGAMAAEFLPNFYGITSAALHHGLPTDRLLVRWDLQSPRVLERLGGVEPAATTVVPSLPRINDVKWQGGWPISSEPRLEMDEPELLLEIPPDWDVLSRSGPRVAEDWQAKVRRALQSYLSRGFVAADFAPTEDGGRRRPYYVLRRG
jgi:predicted GNAT superfamily acetyltransferase